MPATRTPASSPRARSTGTPPRRPLTAQEAARVRQALAAREELARRLLAQQAGQAGQRSAAARTAAPRASTPRSATPRTSAPRTSAPRTSAPRSATPRTSAPRTGTASTPGRPAVRRTPARRPAPRRRRPRDLRRWRTRVGIIGIGAVIVPALASMVLFGPSTPTPATGPTDVGSLALTAQTTLLADAGHYRQLEQVVSQRAAQLASAQDAHVAAQAQAAAERRAVGSSAASLYRSNAAGRYPLVALDVHDPDATSAVLDAQALVDRAEQAREGDIVRAERAAAAVRQAAQRVTDARAALALADREAAGALAATRADVHSLSTAVTAQLASLGTATSAGAQQARDQQALARWQGYLGSLAAAGIDPPPAAQLTDADRLPAGLSPAKDASGHPIPGVAWSIIDTKPVTVLSAETVAAVSSALAQLGKPYVAGASGPDTYDCGGFTSSSWLLAGYSVPVTAQDQWAGGTAVTADDLQVGDLVFTDGGLDVGIYLGDGDVVGASATTFRVSVRSLVVGSPAVRVTLPSAEKTNPALPAAPGMGSCGAELPTPGPVSPAWGGYANGRIPASSLCDLGVAHHELRCDAAAAYRAMSSAFAAAFGTPLCITDSYRSYAGQADAYHRKPKLAAWPGTSNHGWGLAVDLCGGVNSVGTPQWTWMNANAGRFGFVNPDWARPGAEKPEPWHWDFGNLL